MVHVVSGGSGETARNEADTETHTNIPDCEHCKDNPRRKCKFCACAICGGKDSPDKQLMCDDCDMAYHLWCLTPKLDAVPDQEDWYNNNMVAIP